MSDGTQLNELFDEVYSELKALLNDPNTYGCKIFRQPPNNPFFPNIQLQNENKYNGSQTLNYSQRQYPIEYKIELFTIDSGKDTKFLIDSKLEALVIDYMSSKGFNLSSSHPVVNLDTNVHRRFMRFRAVYDIDSKILYKY